MKNVLICNNCHAENPFYSVSCKKCNSYLRARIVNIDLWDTLWKLLESPVKTAELIIHSEHKNFSFSILILAAIKIGLSFLVVSNAVGLFGEEISNPVNFVLIGAISFIVAIILISIISTGVNKLFGIQNRMRDNFALYSYSLLPLILVFVILTPVQIALFGTYWFTFNPSPLIFKPLVTFVLFFIEVLFMGWSSFLIVTSNYAQSKNIFYSLMVGIIVLFFIVLFVYSITKYIY